MSRLPAAVIVGADLNGLGVVRSLASLNMPIFVVGKSRFDSAMLSRFAHPVVTPRLEGADLVSVLIELGPKIGGDAVLFITDEIAVETISASRKVLEKFYRFTMPPPDTVDMLMDKRRFHQFAMDRGLPVPVSIGITGKETLSELARLDYPVVIKPCDKMLVHTGQIARLGVARHRTEAEAICRDMLPVAQSLIVQEWIHGPQENICFCLFYRAADGGIVRSFAGRKLVCVPPQVGNTAVCAPACEWQDEILACTRRVLAETDFIGLGSLEYKWDNHRGKLFIIEATVGRTDWQEEVATACGVNIPAASYCTEAGLDLPPAQTKAAIWQSSYLHRIPASYRRSDMPIVNGFWRREDPLPAVVYYARAPWRMATQKAAKSRSVNHHGS